MLKLTERQEELKNQIAKEANERYLIECVRIDRLHACTEADRLHMDLDEILKSYGYNFRGFPIKEGVDFFEF